MICVHMCVLRLTDQIEPVPITCECKHKHTTQGGLRLRGAPRPGQVRRCDPLLFSDVCWTNTLDLLTTRINTTPTQHHTARDGTRPQPHVLPDEARGRGLGRGGRARHGCRCVRACLCACMRVYTHTCLSVPSPTARNNKTPQPIHLSPTNHHLNRQRSNPSIITQQFIP